MDTVSLAVGSGTLGLGSINLGLARLSPAEEFYSEWLELAEASAVFSMPLGGIGPCLRNYAAIERQLLDYAGDGMIDLVGHSQNSLHFARFLVRHRLKVRKALLVNGPFGGANLARKFRGIPCAIDMRPGSPFIEALRQELAKAFKRFAREQKRNPQYHVPECHFFGLKHDRIVHHGSPNPELGALVTHHCIGGGERPLMADRFFWHGFDNDPNHISVVRHEPTLEIFRQVLVCEGAWAESAGTTVIPAKLAVAA